MDGSLSTVIGCIVDEGIVLMDGQQHTSQPRSS